MKAALFLLVLLPFVLANPAKQRIPRRINPDAEDPDFRRYITVEDGKGGYKTIDLRGGINGTVTPRVELSDVEYDLYTRSNPSSPYTIRLNDISALGGSNYDPRRLTVFVIHGWNNNRNSNVNILIRDAIFGNNDVNLFVVDWSGLANDLIYVTSVAAVNPVGQIVGDFINQMYSTYGVDGNNFVLIGHSLGAHVCGSVGSTVNSPMSYIIGLDPAGPLFSMDDTNGRLDTTDAMYVAIIHTCGSVLGMDSSIGDADYWPNGGMSQPGCGLDLAGTCSHGRSYRYLAESLTRGAQVFNSWMCFDWNTFQGGNCGSNAQSPMVALSPEGDHANFFLTTNDAEPFGQS